VGLLPLSVTLHQDHLLDKSWSRAFTLVVRERSSRTPSAAVTCLVPPFGKAHGSGHVFEPRTLDQVGRTRAPERSGRTAQLRSLKTAASAFPPPTHMVSTPKVLSWNWSPLIRVLVIRAPVLPNG